MNQRKDGQTRLWIRSRDSLGNPVDDKLIEAAHRVWERARLVVIRFLAEDTEVPEILEAIVDAASRTGANNQSMQFRRLQDGRQLPAGYHQFSHGYAVTAHRSQGKTVDFEIIAAERMAHDLFYVSATRAREGLTVITSDSLGLQEAIAVSGDRQSVSELARRSAPATPIQTLTHDDLFRLYEAQQRAPQPVLKKEIHHDVNRKDTGLDIGR